MNIRSLIKEVLTEELRSLANPLDKAADAVSTSTAGFGAKVDALKKQAKKERDDITVNMNAKNKAKAVRQSNHPEVERQRRQLMDKEIEDLDLKRKQKDAEQIELDGMTDELGGLTGSLEALEKERDALQAALAGMDMGGEAL